MPEWYLVILVLAGVSALGLLWPPLLAALPLLMLAVGASLMRAVTVAAGARFHRTDRSARAELKLRALTGLLHLMQPLARLWGRLRHGLSPWRGRHPPRRGALPLPRVIAIRARARQPVAARLEAIERDLRGQGLVVRRGGEFDRWDIEARSGALGAARLMIGVEDCGGGQLIRVRTWPRAAPAALGLALIAAALAALAALDRSWVVATVLVLIATAPVVRAAGQCAVTARIVKDAIARIAGVTERASASAPRAGDEAA